MINKTEFDDSKSALFGAPGEPGPGQVSIRNRELVLSWQPSALEEGGHRPHGLRCRVTTAAVHHQLQVSQYPVSAKAHRRLAELCRRIGLFTPTHPAKGTRLGNMADERILHQHKDTALNSLLGGCDCVGQDLGNPKGRITLIFYLIHYTGREAAAGRRAPRPRGHPDTPQQ